MKMLLYSSSRALSLSKYADLLLVLPPIASYMKIGFFRVKESVAIEGVFDVL
jgi:hypothetical protein